MLDVVLSQFYQGSGKNRQQIGKDTGTGQPAGFLGQVGPGTGPGSNFSDLKPVGTPQQARSDQIGQPVNNPWTRSKGIEHTWSILNSVGFATKEMGEGGHHDNIEDKVDHVNFKKNIGQVCMYSGEALARNELDESITASLCRDWQQKIDTWERDRENEPNPYLVEGGKQAGPTKADVSAQLAAAELEEVRQEHVPVPQGKMTVVAFIKVGLDLWQSQLCILADLKGSTLSADISSQIQEQHMALMKKVSTWEKLQETYILGVAEADEEKCHANVPAPQAKHIKLYLPSNLTPEERRMACCPYLVEVEAKLCHAQCATNIATLQSRLHAQAHLIAFRNDSMRTLLGKKHQHVRRHSLAMVVTKYRKAQAALTVLKGASFAKDFRELKAEDLMVHQPDESETQSRKKLNRVGFSKRARNEPTLAASKVKQVSWIFTVGREAGEGEIHNSICVEWSKAKARQDCWHEEVRYLCSEMKCLLRSLATMEAEWEEWATQRGGVEEQRGPRHMHSARLQCTTRLLKGFIVDGANGTALRSLVNREIPADTCGDEMAAAEEGQIAGGMMVEQRGGVE
ncbi:hypothetical protein GGX14DRAFT_406796 [Mycena pura]|uniref:Uncharacterized protein n=1 Tax=Mycena pura TaxID=153505 RepID=A0AAD6Y302_9AGAR|nr:hypothetical protein GGX14DRAFT_406796 [Mycena pura]